MKHFIIAILIALALAAPAYSTDTNFAQQTISQLPFQPTNIGVDRTYTVSVTNGSATVLTAVALPSDIVGRTGYTVSINGTLYAVASIPSTGTLTLTTNYSGSTGSATLVLYKFVYLRVHADQTFRPASSSQIVQQSSPGSGLFYAEYAVSIRNVGSGNVAYIQPFTIPATVDSDRPSGTYQFIFYGPTGNKLANYACPSNKTQLRVPSTVNNFADLCTYNSGSVPPVPDQYYTIPQINTFLPSCTANQMIYFAATGRAQSCLTLGTGLSITSGTLNATGATSLVGAREAVNVKRDHSCAGDGVTNDTACIVAAITAAQSSGKELYFPAGTYLTDTITQSLSNLVVIGDSYKNSIIKARNANTPILSLTGSNYAVDMVIQDLGFVGQGATSGSSGHCIYINDTVSGLAQATLRNVHISQCGGKGVYVPQMFNVLLDSVVVDHVGGNGFELHGSNTTTLIRTYVKTLDGAGTVAYRIYAGTPTFIGANGIDSCPNGNCDWGVMGRLLADDGVDSYVRLNCTNCNIEDFKRYGIRFKYYSSGNFFNTNFFAPASGTVVALKYDYVDDTIQGIFDGQSSIVTQGASWTNGYPIHANANPFHSFSITTAPYNTFWNGTDAQIMPQWGYSFESGIGQYFSRSTGLAADKLKIGGGGIPTGYQSYFRSTSTTNIGLAVTQAVSQTARPFIVENATSSVIFGVNTDGSVASNAGGALAFTVKDTSGNALLRAARANTWGDSVASSFAQLGGSAESGWISGLNAATLPRLGITATKTHITDTDTGSVPAPGSNLLGLYKTTSGNVAFEIKTSTVQTGDAISYHDSTAVKFKVNASGYATTERLRLSNVAGDPSSPANGDMAYNSTAGKFRCYEAGAWANCIGSGGGGGGITSITAPSGGAQTGPGIAIALGTSGTDASIAGSANTITFNFPTASASNRGLLSASDFSMFNSKAAVAGGGITTSQVAVGTAASTIGGSSALTAGGGSVLSTGGANSAVGFSQTNSSSGAVAQAVYALNNNSSDQATFGLTSSGFTTSGLFAARQAYVNADTGITNLLFRLNDTTTTSFKFGISTSQVARIDETGLSIGTIAPSTKIDVASTGLSAGFAGVRFRNISNATSPDTGITSGYLGVDASGYVKVITTPGGLPDPGANGILARTALNTLSARTITGTSNEITVADGNGVSANPTLSIAATFDISGKTSTKPMKSGTVAGIPGTCGVGEYYFATDASAGSNTYACTAVNTWTVQAVAGSAGALSALTAAVGGNSINNGDNAQVWNWALTTSGKTGFSFAENSAGTSAGTPHLVSISTRSTSTINPLQVVINSNTTPAGIRVNTSGLVVAVGTGGVDGSAIVTANSVANSVLDADLAALGNNSTDGLLTHTGAGTVSARTLTAGSASLTVSNGNGVSGNPTVDTVQNIQTTATPQFAALGLGVAAPSAGLLVTGKTISTDATNTVGASSLAFSVTKNDTNTRVFYGEKITATLNTGGSNANTTVNLLAVDTTNTAVTGLTTNLLSLNYGGASKLLVDSGGNATFGGAITVTGCTGCGNAIVSPATTAYSVVTTDALVAADATSAAFTVTYFTAVGNNNKVVTTCKVDTSSNNVSVSATSTYTLSAPGQCVTLASNNTSWYLVY